MLVLSFVSTFCWKLIFFSRANSRIYIFFSAATLFLLSVLRSPEEGVDIPNYINHFDRLSAESFEAVLLLAASGELSDPVFWLFTLAMAKLGLDPWVWISSISFLFVLSVSRFVQKHSDFPLLSFVLMMSLGYLGFSYSGLRQTVALSIVIISLSFLLEGRKSWFLVGVLLASLFHFSAISCILFLFANIKFRLYHYVVGVVIALVFGIFLDSHIRSLIGVVGGQQYSGYMDRDIALNFTGVFVYLLIFSFCLTRLKQVSSRWSSAPLLYNALFIGFGFQCLSLIVAEMFRVAMYFNIVSLILVGWVLMSYESRLFRSLAYLSIMGACIALFFVPKI